MKTALKVVMIFFILTFFLNADVVNSIVVVVANMPVTTYDFENRRAFMRAHARGNKKTVTDEDVYKDLIEEKVMEIKLIQYGFEIDEREVVRELERIMESNNIPNMKTFEALIKAEGMDFNEYKISIRRQIAMQNLFGVASSNMEVTDAEADKYYASATKEEKAFFEGDTSVQLSWIFFKANSFTEKAEKEALARQVYNEAIKGADFAELARKYSDDDQNKNSGGNLGYYFISDLMTRRLPSQISTPLTMVKNGSKAGTVTKVGETVGRGFWIVKITDIKIDINSIRNKVKNYLYEKNAQTSFDKWLEAETERLSVIRFPAIGSQQKAENKTQQKK